MMEIEQNYLGLEALKSLSEDELYFRWNNYLFPFDDMNCGECLTEHIDLKAFCEASHLEKVKKQLKALGITDPCVWVDHQLVDDKKKLKEQLKEIYDLRILFKDEYSYHPMELAP